MEVKLLCPLWGHEHLDLLMFLNKIKDARFDGIDTWVPQNSADKRILYDFLQRHGMHIVTHQHEAEGSTFKKFKSSFLQNLQRCAEPGPLLINSHTGRDHFSLQQYLDLIDIAHEFSEKTGITVAHETHRGRMGYSPQMISSLFELRKDFSITADFSHWVCVTESMLQNFKEVLDEAIKRTRHIHARVGFEEGPQVPDPAAPEWEYAMQHFISWWDRIVISNKKNGNKILSFTTEFGPPPYMPVIPFTQKPIADQFSINCFMRALLKERYHPLFS